MNHIQFLNKFRTISKISLEIDKFLGEWGNDLPVMLFGEIGRAIAINLSEFSRDEYARIFAYIQEGMLDGEETLKNYIATGLLESMYNSSQETGTWPSIQNALDSVSIRYIRDWINFQYP